jgi:hypothetical protein
MLQRCAQAVRAAAKELGREGLTDADLKSIDDRMSETMRRLARQDPEWRTYTGDMRTSLAAEQAIADIRAEAQRKADNKVRQVVAVAQVETQVQGLIDAFGGGRVKGLKRHMKLTHVYESAIRRDAQGDLMNLIEAAGDKQGTGLGRRFLMMAFDAENPGMTRDIAAEIFKNADGHSGNKVATAAARAWLDTIEGLRQRFNAAGGDVGKLEYGYTPQPHDRARIAKVGRDTWVSRTLPMLDRSRYVLEDGSRMGDAEVGQMLGKAWESITSDGLNKLSPGEFHGTGARANRGGDPRQIHFADGQAWVDYMKQYGKGTLYDAMMAHISGVTRDIALVERYGPDIQATARLQFDLAAKADGRKPENLAGPGTIDPRTYWNIITGRTGAPVDESLAQGFKIARDIQSAAKLGGAVISSVTDLGTLAITTGYNRLPYWQLLKDVGSNVVPDWMAKFGVTRGKDLHEWMSAHGMIAESIASGLNRWSGDHIGNGWSGKLTNNVMRFSLMNAWTDGLRQGFVLTMNAGLARMSRTEWGALTEFDRSRLARAGIIEEDWGKLAAVPLEQFKGRELLTPQAIKQAGHQDLAARVFGFIADESEYAVLNPDLATRAITTMGGLQAGTWSGELARIEMQFKSFAVSMFTRHWARMLEGDHGAEGAPLLANRGVYSFALMATLTGMGAVAVQEKQILQGKDPINMGNWKFWAKAVAQGGGLGIMGDLMLVDPSNSPGDSATNAIKNLAGPVVGSVFEVVFKDIVENIWQATEGKDTHWAAELASTARSNIPGNTVWWVKPFIDHGFMNALNEMMSPGYLSRMKQRAYKDWGNHWWWAPQDATPARAPDLGAALP